MVATVIKNLTVTELKASYGELRKFGCVVPDFEKTEIHIESPTFITSLVIGNSSEVLSKLEYHLQQLRKIWVFITIKDPDSDFVKCFFYKP